MNRLRRAILLLPLLALFISLPLQAAEGDVIRIDAKSSAAEVLYRKPTSLRNTYRVGQCSLPDELDGVMAELAQQAAQ